MKLSPYILLLLLASCLNGQRSIEESLDQLNRGSVPYISVSELAATQQFLLLDTRSREEYEVSHLKNAMWVGYDDFELARLDSLVQDRTTPIVVYCSVGVRSEDIGEKLMQQGFSEVRNLYGGIFEWMNEQHPVFDETGKETNRIHAYNKQWGTLLTRGEKVY